MQLSSIGGDRNIVSLKRIIFWGCHFRGYLLIVFINSIYLSYVLQAGYRLFRIIFNEYICLQTVSTFSYYILIQWIISFVILLPILFAGKNLSNSIVYLSEDFYCQVPITNIYSVSYSVFVVYLLPLCCMCIIYFWIIIYIRRNTIYRQSVATLKLRHQNKRDTIIIKRICIVVILLLTLGIPPVIFFIGFIITGQLHWAFYRLSWMTISISYAFICLSSIYVTPQIYRPIRIIFRYSKRHKKNVEDSIIMNDITKTRRTMEISILHKNLSTNIIELD